MAYVNGQWVPEDASVAGQVAKLQSQDSPLMRQATAAGERSAARRGLVNSSMGIGAGINAALGAVTPIASADAAQIQQSNINRDNNQAQAANVAAQIAQADRANYGKAVSDAASTYTTGIANTLQNDKIPWDARNKAQSDMAGLWKSQQDQLAKLYNVNLTWGTA